MQPGPNGAGLSRRAILAEIDDSLRRLGTDYVDLYQIHRWDYDTPIEETLEALHDVVKAGKARYIGASSMYAWQFAKALYISRLNGWTEFVSHAEPSQPALPRGRARNAAALQRSEASRVMPWSPLARGRLTRDLGRDERAAETDEFGRTLYDATSNPTARSLSAVSAKSPRRAACRARRSRSPGSCRKTASPRRSSALRSSTISTTRSRRCRCKLSADEIAKLEAPYVPHPIVGFQ